MKKEDKEELIAALFWVIASIFLLVLSISATLIWNSKIALFITIALIMVLIFWLYALRFKVREIKSKKRY